MEKEVMTTKQAADYIGVTKIWFGKHIKKKYNLIPAYQDSGSRTLLYNKQDIEEIAKQENPSVVLKEYYGWNN